MTVLAIAPTHNAPKKKDVTHAFLPEARAFAKLYGGRVFQFDNRAVMSVRRAQVEKAIHNYADIQTLAVFCHGWQTGMQTGHRLRDMKGLAEVITDCAPEDVTVVLYCCSMAQGGTGGDGGAADRLRDELCKAGAYDCRVVAHYTKGHTTRNPYVRVFDGLGSLHGGAGGMDPVRPGSELWTRWKRMLRDSEAFRFTFPFMSVREIHKTVAG